MTTVAAARLHHLAITVTDLDRSVEWYEQVFDIRHRFDEPHDGGLGRLLADDAMELIIVLHHHDSNTGGSFAATVTGLDHVGFLVPHRDDLVAWQTHLDALGVAHARVADRPLTRSAITDRPYGSVLVFRDPDNVQLELFAPPG